ncbi:MAG: hypothetical protein Q8O55_11595 [Dehalococcoidales bacterium]|nr:hypothetical protein [Dehalococcoidales bacterium]
MTSKVWLKRGRIVKESGAIARAVKRSSLTPIRDIIGSESGLEALNPGECRNWQTGQT